jgi:hypothetical protein
MPTRAEPPCLALTIEEAATALAIPLDDFEAYVRPSGLRMLEIGDAAPIVPLFALEQWLERVWDQASGERVTREAETTPDDAGVFTRPPSG